MINFAQILTIGHCLDALSATRKISCKIYRVVFTEPYPLYPPQLSCSAPLTSIEQLFQFGVQFTIFLVFCNFSVSAFIFVYVHRFSGRLSVFCLFKKLFSASMRKLLADGWTCSPKSIFECEKQISVKK